MIVPSTGSMQDDVPGVVHTGFWQAVWLLLKLRWTIAISGIKRGKRRTKFRYVLLLVFILVLVGGAIFLTWKFLDFMRSTLIMESLVNQDELQPLILLLSNIPILITSGVFIILLLTSFGVMLQALYLSKDIDFLLVMPLPTKSIFLAKMIQAILPNLSIVFLFALPVMFILGYIKQYSFVYYPLVFILFIALALAACGISSLLVMAIVRIIPARRVAEVLGFLGAVFSILCSQSGQLARFESISGDQVERLVGLNAILATSWSPLSWAGRGLVATGEAEWLQGLGLLAIVLVLCGLSFGASLLLSESLYYSGWASLQGVSTRKKVRKQQKKDINHQKDRVQSKGEAGAGLWLDRMMPSPLKGLLVKDSLVLRRDLRNLSQLVTPIIIGIVYSLLLFRGGDNPFGGRGDAPKLVQEGLRSLSIFGNVFISLFVSWSLLSRLAGMGFSMEGKNFWILKTSPVSSSILIAGKYIIAYVPTFALSSLFLVIVSIISGSAWKLLPYTIPAIALIVAGNCGLNLSFGLAGARLDWEDPRQMQRFWSGCLGAIVTFIYLPISLVFFFGPSVILPIFGMNQNLGYAVGFLLGTIFSLMVTVIPLLIVQKRIESLGEV